MFCSHVGFSYKTKIRQCNLFKIQDTSAGLLTEEDTQIFVKKEEVECLVRSQCPLIDPLSVPECIDMKCQYCSPYYLQVSKTLLSLQYGEENLVTGHGGDEWAV